MTHKVVLLMEFESAGHLASAFLLILEVLAISFLYLASDS